MIKKRSTTTKPFLISVIGNLQRKKYVENRNNGLRGIETYEPDSTQLYKTAYHLGNYLGMKRGSDGSWYTRIITPTMTEVVSFRVSDHLSTDDEFRENETIGIPNRRYSIVVFNRHSMYDQYKNGIKFIDWNKRDIDGSPIFEVVVNCDYLPHAYGFLYAMIVKLYEGGTPESISIPVNYKLPFEKIKESKTYKNMKKNVQRINETQLRAIVAESIKKVLKESTLDESDTQRRVDGSYGPYHKVSRNAHEFARGLNKAAFREREDYLRQYRNEHPESVKPQFDKEAAKAKFGFGGLNEGYKDDPSWEDYYSHNSDEVLNKVAKLLLQAQRILEPVVNIDEGEKYLSVSQHIGSLLHYLKTM